MGKTQLSFSVRLTVLFVAHSANSPYQVSSGGYSVWVVKLTFLSKEFAYAPVG